MTQPTLNDLTVEQLSQLFDWISVTADATQNFILEQAPLVTQEYVKYTLINNCFIAGLFLIFFISVLSIFIGTFIHKGSFIHEIYEVPTKKCIASILSGVLLFICLLSITVLTRSVDKIIKASVAPRVLVLEWASDQVSQ